jgi:hypothetical protein
MKLLNSFIHGNALTEIFLEGHNPNALRKLDTADLDEVRQKVLTSEILQGYLIGRIVGAGRGVWVMTDQCMVLLNCQSRSVERIDLDQIKRVEAERGRYGHTVRLTTSTSTWSLYGVDLELARCVHAALVKHGIDSTFEDKEVRSYAWRQSSPQGWAQDCVKDARIRLNPSSEKLTGAELPG